MKLLAAAGPAPAAVLLAATRDKARPSSREGRLGSVAAGKLADLLLPGAVPTADIGDTR